MDIYEHFKAQDAKIESFPELFMGDYSCYLYQGQEGEENILVIAPHKGRMPSAFWLNVQHKLSQNTTFQNGRKCHNTCLAGEIKCGCYGHALVSLNAANGVTYMRCKQSIENKSCPGPGTLTRQELETSVYDKIVKKIWEFQTLMDGKAAGYNPKLTAAHTKHAKIETEIEKLIDMLDGANSLLLQYVNSRIEELDAEWQKQLKLVANLTDNSVSNSQLDSISGYLKNWDEVNCYDKWCVVDMLISRIEATSTELVIHWKI